jgi:hypothetical protein
MLTANDFRRIALGMEGAVESSHMDHPDFRVGNRIFATLTHDERMGMVSLAPDVQEEFMQAHPAAFSMVNGTWGLQGATWVHLESADEDALGEAMTIAWRTAVAKGPTKPRSKTAKPARTAKPAKTAKGAKPATKKIATPKAAAVTRTLKELLAPYPRAVQSLARAARALMTELLPKVEESIDRTGPYITYGYGPGYKGVVGYITVNQKGVKLGVAGGASLPDPKKLLQGSGKSNRHVVISTPADLQTPGLRQLVRAALAAWKKEHA